MRPHRMLLCFAVGLSLFGCRGLSKTQTELVRRELRMQEDRMFELEDMLADAQAAIDSSRRENESLKQELAGGDKGAGPAAGAASTPPPSPSRPSGTRPVAPPVAPVLPDLKPPVIELPDMPDASEIPPQSPRGSRSSFIQGASFNRRTPRKAAPPSDQQSASDQQPAIDQMPASIVINPLLTGGRSHNGRFGDEGLLVVFETRNAAKQAVNALGDVSIVVLDPAKQGAAARVARWDYAADEVSAHYHGKGIGPGFQFELPWPSTPPTSRSLHLFVRFTTPAGHKLVADSMIKAEPLEPKPQGWTAAPLKRRWPGAISKLKPRAAESFAETAPPRPASRLRKPSLATERLQRSTAADSERDPLETAPGEIVIEGPVIIEPNDREAALPQGAAVDPEPELAPRERGMPQAVDVAQSKGEQPKDERFGGTAAKRKRRPLRQAKSDRPEWRPYR